MFCAKRGFQRVRDMDRSEERLMILLIVYLRICRDYNNAKRFGRSEIPLWKAVSDRMPTRSPSQACLFFRAIASNDKKHHHFTQDSKMILHTYVRPGLRQAAQAFIKGDSPTKAMRGRKKDNTLLIREFEQRRKNDNASMLIKIEELQKHLVKKYPASLNQANNARPPPPLPPSRIPNKQKFNSVPYSPGNMLNRIRSLNSKESPKLRNHKEIRLPKPPKKKNANSQIFLPPKIRRKNKPQGNLLPNEKRKAQLGFNKTYRPIVVPPPPPKYVLDKPAEEPCLKKIQQFFEQQKKRYGIADEDREEKTTIWISDEETEDKKSSSPMLVLPPPPIRKKKKIVEEEDVFFTSSEESSHTDEDEDYVPPNDSIQLQPPPPPQIRKKTKKKNLKKFIEEESEESEEDIESESSEEEKKKKRRKKKKKRKKKKRKKRKKDRDAFTTMQKDLDFIRQQQQHLFSLYPTFGQLPIKQKESAIKTPQITIVVPPNDSNISFEPAVTRSVPENAKILFNWAPEQTRVVILEEEPDE